MVTATEQLAGIMSYGAFTGEQWDVGSKTEGPVVFRPTAAQRIVRAERRRLQKAFKAVLLKILKARQQGISTDACAYVQHCCMTRRGHVGLSIADKLDLPKVWLRRAIHWHRQTPERMRPHLKLGNAIEMYYDNLDSRYHIASQAGQTPGMGETIHRLHCSEVANWRDHEKVLSDLMPAVPKNAPNTSIEFESTGEMVGDWWHQAVMASLAGEDEYTLIFLPWFITEEYALPAELTEADYTADERDVVALAAAWAKQHPHYATIARFEGVNPFQIAWRRWVIANEFFGNDDLFRSRYPSTIAEAFMAAGAAIYTPQMHSKAMGTVREPEWLGNLLYRGDPSNVQLEGNESGELRIWEHPKADMHYVLGADNQWGKSKESAWDVACVECIETGKLVAKAKGRYPFSVWAGKLAALGYLYNEAWVAPERNGQVADGLMPILLGYVGEWTYPKVWIRTEEGRLRGSGKAKDYGWYTDQHTKGSLVSFSQQMTTEGTFDWCDEATVAQMATIVRREDGGIGCPDGMHDDDWMARLIAAYISHKERGWLLAPEATDGRSYASEEDLQMQAMLEKLDAPQSDHDDETEGLA